MSGDGVGTGYVMDARRDRLVITASALGTLFEWYDFYIYGVLAPIIGRTFFPTDTPTVELLYSLAGFAIGFGFRPLGAALFGYQIGRASCRERVCQYVSLSVVAVSLKKQYKT